MCVNLIRTSDVNFLWLQVANRLLLKSLQAALAKPTTVTQCKDSDNLPIIKVIYKF